MSYHNRALAVPIKCNFETTRSVHEQVSTGYYAVSDNGDRTYVPYKPIEMAKIHQFITPTINWKNQAKWKKIKARLRKNPNSTKKGKWTYTSTFGGLNTAPRA